MTKEEAIEFGNMWIEVNKDCKDSNTYEFFQMAIKALEQQPCDDCISRAKAIEEADNLCLETAYDNEKVIEMLNDLPSVTPKEKTGKWIDDADKIDAQFGKHTYKCSECGKYAEYFVSGTEVWWDRIKPNFCPNCGARMVSE